MRRGAILRPYTHAPPDWHENGVPYGAYCKCTECGYVGRSTLTFDYYASSPGEPLVCAACKGISTRETERAWRQLDEEEGLRELPNA